MCLCGICLCGIAKDAVAHMRRGEINEDHRLMSNTSKVVKAKLEGGIFLRMEVS